jgi:adenylyl- and sulfurtransferase ThiI
MSFNFSSQSYTQKVNLKCIVTQTKKPCITLDKANVQTILDKFSTFEISFVPPVDGTYKIVSKNFMTTKPYLLSVHSQKATKDLISTLFSNAELRKS